MKTSWMEPFWKLTLIIHSWDGTRVLKTTQVSLAIWMTTPCWRRMTSRDKRGSSLSKSMLSEVPRSFPDKTVMRYLSSTISKESQFSPIHQTQITSLWITVSMRSTSGLSSQLFTTKRRLETIGWELDHQGLTPYLMLHSGERNWPNLTSTRRRKCQNSTDTGVTGSDLRQSRLIKL